MERWATNPSWFAWALPGFSTEISISRETPTVLGQPGHLDTLFIGLTQVAPWVMEPGRNSRPPDTQPGRWAWHRSAPTTRPEGGLKRCTYRKELLFINFRAWIFTTGTTKEWSRPGDPYNKPHKAFKVGSRLFRNSQVLLCGNVSPVLPNRLTIQEMADIQIFKNVKSPVSNVGNLFHQNKWTNKKPAWAHQNTFVGQTCTNPHLTILT